MNDRQLLKEAGKAIAQAGTAVLCMILGTEGSTPRSAGAMMLVTGDGRSRGTVGGGKAEYQAVTLAQQLLRGEEIPETVSVDMSETQGGELICGGKAELGFFLLTQAHLRAIEDALDILASKKSCTICWEFGSGTMEVQPSDGAASPRLENRRFRKTICPEETLYLFGGGHVGQALVPVLAALDFQIVVMDDRAEIATEERFPMARQVILGDFSHIGSQIQVTERDYAVVMTHGHKADLVVLEQLLGFKPRYLGCLGSRRKWGMFREHLESAGFTPEEVGKIHLPIGLPIGAETPEEIAVSIAAQLIEVRAAVPPDKA